MPIVAHRPGDPRSVASSPSGVLLPPDGETLPIQPPVPTRALAAEARWLAPHLEASRRSPAAWSDPAFVREVALVRAHLAPIRSQAGLAASYGREAFQSSVPPGKEPGPVRVAYAIRWLELGDGRARPQWPPSAATASQAGVSAAT